MFRYLLISISENKIIIFQRGNFILFTQINKCNRKEKTGVLETFQLFMQREKYLFFSTEHTSFTSVLFCYQKQM